MLPATHILQELNETAPLFPPIPQLVPFSVPAGYFETFPNLMLQQVSSIKPANGILQEITETAPLSPTITQVMPYSVPEGYFDSFALSMLQQVLQPVQLAEAPEGYFEGFAAGMLDKVRMLDIDSDVTQDEELKEIAPLLSTMSRQMPYHIPQGYFEQLIPITGAVQMPVKVISISTAWKRVAAAASVALLIGLGWWLYSGADSATGKPPSLAAIESRLVDVDKDALEGYLENTGYSDHYVSYLFTPAEEVDAQLQDLSTESLQYYLETQPQKNTNEGMNM